MADITFKDVFRGAVASGKIELKPSTIARIRKGTIAKGDPIAAASRGRAGRKEHASNATILPSSSDHECSNGRQDRSILGHGSFDSEDNSKDRC